MKNPSWQRDELILALDLYFRLNKLPDNKDPEVIKLSGLLNRLPIHQIRPDRERFRNSNGVAMKLANFASIDPDYQGSGLKQGGKLEKEIWCEFSNNKILLRTIAEEIISITTMDDLRLELADIDISQETVGSEGRVLLKYHKYRERDSSLAKKKKIEFERINGKLFCEACGFDFQNVYGGLGQGFIECHHLTPLFKLQGSGKTKLSELALLCANCHRMVHRSKTILTITQLKAQLIK